MNDERDLRETVERATELLLPVVVDLGAATYEAQLSALEDLDEIDIARLVLAPIATEGLPLDHRGPFTITPAVGGYAWSLRCTDVVHAGDKRASVALRSTRFDTITVRDDAVRATELLVLIVPGGLDDGVDYVFPITRIGPASCHVRCSMALPTGSELPYVEIIGDRRVLRTASAQVTRTTPWYGADGARAFVSTLSLGAPRSDAPEQAHDLVTNPHEVVRALKLLAMRQGPLEVAVPGVLRVEGRMLQVGSDSASIEARIDAALALPLRTSVRIAFQLFSVPHEMDVRVIERGEGTLKTTLPLILRRRRRHRRDARTQLLPEQAVTVRYRNPITGLIASQPVIDASFYGIAFRVAAGDNLLWEGLPLEQAQLTWQDHCVQLGDLIVDELETDARGTRCTALTHDSRLPDDVALIDLLAAAAHPGVSVHDGAHFEALHRTYVKAGLFGPHMHRNLAPIVEQTAAVWRALHLHAGDVVRTFVHGPEGAPDGAVTVMRAWENGWVLQHFVDTSNEQGVGGKLQLAYFDHLVPRPDGRYIVFFVKEDNSIMNAYLRRFFDTSGTAEALTCSNVELWIRVEDGLRERKEARDQLARTFPESITLEPCSAADELVVAHAAQRSFGAHAAAAISAVPGQIRLPDNELRFGNAGLVRKRDCVLVRRDGRVVYALLEEHSTPGLNLTWMLNATWIIPVHTEHDADGLAFERALAWVVERPSQSATGDRFVNIPPGFDAERLAGAGFAREAGLNFYVLNRAGMHRFFQYTAVRYGELETMVMRKQRRRTRE
jgi:hypothetical protein